MSSNGLEEFPNLLAMYKPLLPTCIIDNEKNRTFFRRKKWSEGLSQWLLFALF